MLELIATKLLQFGRMNTTQKAASLENCAFATERTAHTGLRKLAFYAACSSLQMSIGCTPPSDTGPLGLSIHKQPGDPGAKA